MFLYIYIAVVVCCITSYIFALKILRLPLISFSNLAYLYAILLVMIPGYSISSGAHFRYLLGGQFYRGFDIDLYLIYLFFIIITTFGLILGQRSGNNKFIRIEPRSIVQERITLLILFVSLYAIIYIMWVPSLPIIELAKGKSLFNVMNERISITHQQGEMDNIPLPLRYWRSIIQTSFIFLYICYLYISKSRGILNFLVKMVLFVFVSFCLLFTIEKAAFIYFLVAIMFAGLIKSRPESFGNLFENIMMNKKILFLIVIIACSPFILYYYLMAAKEDVLNVTIDRLGVQTASTYLQIEYARAEGFLGLSGIRMPFLTHLIDYDYHDLSKRAIEDLHPEHVLAGFVGAAGGLSLAQLYFCFGWIALPIFALFIFTIGFIDRVAINTIFDPQNTEAFYVNLAFYSTFSGWYAMAVVSSVFVIFSIPLILDPGVIILIGIYCCLVRPRL